MSNNSPDSSHTVDGPLVEVSQVCLALTLPSSLYAQLYCVILLLLCSAVPVMNLQSTVGK